VNLGEIEENVRAILNSLNHETFIYTLLGAYGKPKASITRLQKGNLNLAKNNDEVIWKKNVYYKRIPLNSGVDIHVIADQLKRSDLVSKHDLRFVVVTDFKTLLAVDTKTFETLDIPLLQLAKHAHFFLPWTGQEKHKSHNENPADIKAAYKMGKLYDEICTQNPEMRTRENHSLNVFLARLLFCFFAEDTFTDSIASHTQDNASDLSEYLEKLWVVLNSEKRNDVPGYFEKFPYVNGGLFTENLTPPKFSRTARKIILECGELDWSEINPDIFGSMMQAVVHPNERAETGMHYTSVSNIMKVIEPLFLNDLRADFENNRDNSKGLERLLKRLYNIKVMDPACGSGNFLIIAYKELRKLEMEIYHCLRALNIKTKGIIFLPQIRLAQFFGIEIDDFAHEIAIMSLWLAEHQMNVKFKENFGQVIPPLPLKESGHIACGNSTQLEWNEVCPIDGLAEVFVLGNPPYLGSSNQSDLQKSDLDIVFKGKKNYKSLDYISCFFYKGAQYIARDIKAKLAFVSTNSICQGEQIELLWTHIFDLGLEIAFAHLSFKWQNNAKHNAGVTVAIIGLQNKTSNKKAIFSGGNIQYVDNISPYLSSGTNLIVKKFAKPISNLPKMSYGNKPVDGGNLILSKEEMVRLVTAHPTAKMFVKKLVGSDEFINGKDRYCLWIPDERLKEALAIAPIAERIKLVKKMRLASTAEDARQMAARPHQFRDFMETKTVCIIVPSVSSERREYIPIGFLGPDTIITNASAIYEPEYWVFAVVNSKMHNVWVRAIGGRMRTDIRYSSSLCYNNFPFPTLTPTQKESLTTHVLNVLSEREKHSELTMANLYDPDRMPAGLHQAHKDLDGVIERCYRSKPFSNDNERLNYLLTAYEEAVSESVFAKKG
jgi:hypothetical protein